MSKKVRPRSRQKVDHLEQLQRVFSYARAAIWIIAFLLPMIFGVLLFKNLEIVQKVDARKIVDWTDRDLLVGIALFLYYTSWIFATRFDLSIQQETYYIDPKGGSVPKDFIFISFGFLFGGAALLWLRKSDSYLAIALIGFFVFDCLVWLRTKAWATPIVRETEKHYTRQSKHFDAEKLLVVEEMMCGN